MFYYSGGCYEKSKQKLITTILSDPDYLSHKREEDIIDIESGIEVDIIE